MEQKQNTLVKFNMPTAYPPFPTQGTTYDDEVFIKNFEEAKAELPDEVTVLKHFRPEDYPKSLQNELFVAENGCDDNDGSKESPLATVKQALSVLKERGAKGGVIRLREGVYGEQINIGADNIGEADAPLFLTAAEGEKVQLHGAFTLKGSDFDPITDPDAKRKLGVYADKVLAADLKKVGIDADKIAKIVPNQTPALYIDGKEGTLARFPNRPEIPNDFSDLRDQRKEGGVKEASFSRVNDEEESPICIVFDRDVVPLKDWELAEDMWMGGSLFFEWTHWHWRVAKIDKEENSITTESYNMWRRHEGMHWRPSNELFFYNFLEGIDSPGEWYLDRKTSTLYLYPTDDMTPDSTIRLVGEERKAAIVLTDTKNVVISDLEISETNGSCVLAYSSQDVVIDSCVFSHCSARGATGFYNCLRSGVIRSEFIGRGAFIQSPDEYRKTLTPTNNFFQNNLCHKYEYQVGVGVQNGVGDIVSHNRFLDCGLTPGWSNELVIEYNEFDGGPYRGIDTGYIYCPGANFSSRSFHIRNNYFHDSKTAWRGVYLDIHAGGHYIYNNVIQAHYTAIFNSYCSIITNNLILDAKKGLEGNDDNSGAQGRISPYRGDMAWAEKMEQPFWDRHTQLRFQMDDMYAALEGVEDETKVVPTDKIKLLRWGGFHPTYKNVFVNVESPIPNGDEFHAITKTHHETNLSVGGDIGFVDYESKDYRLKPDSIVYKKIPDWVDLPLEKIGLAREQG